MPDDWFPLYVMLVGYPAESWEAGGQRPRPPFEELYYFGQYGTPFPRDPALVEKLKQAKMIQRPATSNNQQRMAEIKALAEKYGLPM